MPYPSLDNVTQLKPIFVDTFDDFSKQLEEYLTKEHKSDGTHAAITADSIDVTGDLDVHGHTGFEDLSGNSIIANDITTSSLDVQDGPLTVGSTVTITAPNSGSSNVRLSEVGNNQPMISLSATNGAGANSMMEFLSSSGHTVDARAEMTFKTITNALEDVGRFGFSFADYTPGAPGGSFIWSDHGGTTRMSLSVGAGAGVLSVSGGQVGAAVGIFGNTTIAATTGVTINSGMVSIADNGNLAINTSKFTVDGATGRLKLAGFIGPVADGTSLQIVNAAASAAIAVFDTTNNRVGFGNVFPGATLDVGNNFTVAGATGNMFTAGTLRAQGAVRFDSLTSGFLKVDGSGNVSKDATVLVGNGVNFGPAAVASITVVGGQITNIS